MSQRNAQNRRFDVETPEAEKQGFDDLKADYPPTFEGNDGKVIAHSLSLAAQDGKAVAFDAHGHALIEIDHAAERRLRWKIDLHIIPIVAIMYMWCFLDRTNIGNARTNKLEAQLGMSGYDYNVALSTFFVAYIVFEIPATMTCKIMGPGRFIPLITFLFGLISMLTAWVTNYGGLCAIRFFLGIAEAGMLPSIAYYLSRWYRKDELVFRLALYIVAAPIAGAVGGLIAYGVFQLKSIGSLTDWRMLFLVDGVITMGFGIIGYFAMTNSAETAKWLSPEEKALHAVRIKSGNVGTTVTVDAIHSQSFWQGIFHIQAWLCGFMFLLNNIVVQGIAVFLPTIITAIYPTASVLERNLRTVPPYIVGAFINLLLPFLSWQTGHRAGYMVFAGLLMTLGYAMFLGSTNPQVLYGACFVAMMGAFPFGAFCNGWTAINTSPDTARNAAIGVVVMNGNIGGLISSWSYLTQFAPRFVPGNALNVAGSAIITLLVVATFFWQKWENKQREMGRRDHLLNGLSADQIALLGHRHPNFRFVH